MADTLGNEKAAVSMFFHPKRLERRSGKIQVRDSLVMVMEPERIEKYLFVHNLGIERPHLRISVPAQLVMGNSRVR
jgi:hypothetical protein